jgi:hypothetical protein
MDSSDNMSRNGSSGSQLGTTGTSSSGATGYGAGSQSSKQSSSMSGNMKQTNPAPSMPGQSDSSSKPWNKQGQSGGDEKM